MKNRSVYFVDEVLQLGAADFVLDLVADGLLNGGVAVVEDVRTGKVVGVEVAGMIAAKALKSIPAPYLHIFLHKFILLKNKSL